MTSKKQAIALFFVAELVVGLVLFQAVLGGFDEVWEAWVRLFKLDFSLFADTAFWAMVIVIGAMLVLQAAFLTPVAFPITRQDEKPGWMRMTISGLATAITILVPFLYVAGILFDANRGAIEDGSVRFLLRRPELVLLVGTLVLGVPITIFMKRRWKDGIPIMASIRIAGMVCGLLIAGAVLYIFTLLYLFADLELTTSSSPGVLLLLCVPLVGWIVATPILVRYAKRFPGDSALDKIAKFLLGGTIIELAAIIPFDQLVRRKSDCYCATASFFSLIAAGSAGFIIFGPLVLLIIGRRKARWMKGRCKQCEYELGGFPLAWRCPECGAEQSTPLTLNDTST